MAKKRMSTVTVLALALVFGCERVPFAQQQTPNYKTTANWLASQFPLIGGAARGFGIGHSTNHTIQYSFISMGGCTLQFSEVDKADVGGTTLESEKITTSVPLWSVSEVVVAPDTVFYENTYTVNIRTSMNAISKHEETYISILSPELNGTVRDDHIRAATLYLSRADVDGEALAPRIAAALKNAVSFCKAQVPKSNEPF